MEVDKTQLVEKRKQYLSTSLKTSYKLPILFVKAKYQYLYDENDEEYLGIKHIIKSNVSNFFAKDAYNNVAHVGHCHPKVVESICKQISTINTNTRYLRKLI